MCWPTPTAQDFKKRGPNSSQHGLAESTVNWATPNTMDHMPPRSSEAMEKMLGPEGQRAGRSRPSNLREQIVWPTPRAQKTSSENPESWSARRQAGQVSTPPLAMAAIMWPTVTTQDAKNNAGPSQFERNTKPLNVEATLHSSARARRKLGRDPKSLEPAICRMADGLAHRVDRIRACGNGVVPLAAAYAWRTLISHARTTTDGEYSE